MTPLFCYTLRAEETWEPSLSADFNFSSRYVWRGIAYSDQPVFQPTLGLGFGHLKLSSWFNVNLGPEHDLLVPDGVSEIDPSLAYDFEFKHFNIQPSIVFFLYPDQDYAANTSEAVLSVSRLFGKLTVTTNHQWDILEYAGYYYGQVGAKYRWDYRSTSVSAGLSTGFGSPGFNEAYFGKHEWALNLLQVDVSATRPLTKWMDGAFGISATVIPDSTLGEQVDDRWTITGNAMFSFHLVENNK